MTERSQYDKKSIVARVIYSCYFRITYFSVAVISSKIS